MTTITNRNWLVFSLLVLLLFVLPIPVSAAPQILGMYDVTSKSANITIRDITGSVVWVVVGQNSGGYTWRTENITASLGGWVENGTISGLPVFGGVSYYAQACDDTACGNEVSFTLAEITPVPTTTFGVGYRNITGSRFNLMYLVPGIILAYTNLVPATVFWGLLFGIIVIGFWRRNRGVRLVSVLFIILSPLIMSSNGGLMIGIPLAEQAIGQALLCAGLAGILLSLVKK